MNRLGPLAGIVAVGLFGLAWWAVGGPAEPGRAVGADDVPPPPPPVAGAAGPAVMGATSCAGTGCHGRGAPVPLQTSAFGAGPTDERWKSSYTVWRAYDPHTRAYAVLHNDESKKIAERLWGPDRKAHEDARCLACHTTPSLAGPVPVTDKRTPALRAEGVGCEACHGNAGSWIDAHTGWPSGPGHTARYGPAGMTDLTDVAVRAETCAGCHVGAPATDTAPVRDMNHDLIAAGHPRLNFDYGTYLRMLPPHWAEQDRNAAVFTPRPAGDGPRHWLVGRAATAAAACRLLADRAGRSKLPPADPAHAPWPEFAEFDCYACHFDLTDAGKRTRPPRAGVRPGSLRWTEPPLWRGLAKAVPGVPPAPDVESPMKDLIQFMATGGKAAEAVQPATDAAAAWRTAARAWADPAAGPVGVGPALADLTDPQWDEACHAYYGLMAEERAGARTLDPTRLAELKAALRFPREVNGNRYNSPKGFDARRVGELLRGLVPRGH